MQRRLILNNAARRIETDARPVLFLDTCVMLDAFRVVERASSYTPFNVYVELAKKAKFHEVVVMFNDTIKSEFQFNAPIVVKELRAKILNLNRRWNAFRAMKDKAAVNNDTNLSVNKIVQTAESTLSTIIKDAIVVKDYDAALRSSYDVVLKHKAPAVRDSQFKDAYIFKTCLDLGRKSGRQIIFCSVNTKDYCEDNGSKNVHPDILSQAQANNVVVTLSLGEAYRMLFSE